MTSKSATKTATETATEIPEVSLFGIRHHGPGSAWSLLEALRTLQPDCLLIEGPPEADAVLSYAADEAMVPPIALLNYVKDQPQHATFDPFARYSPEWLALRYGLGANIPTNFMDLPVANYFALQIEHAALNAADSDVSDDLAEGEKNQPDKNVTKVDVAEVDDVASLEPPQQDSQENSLYKDPLHHLAKAAGYNDGERWWEQLVEERQDATGVFAAIQEAMITLRQAVTEEQANYQPSVAEEFHLRLETCRESAMRKRIRKAYKDGNRRIAVVCGAWHVPALLLWNAKGQQKQDNADLKGLPKVKVATTWIPYTTRRLSRSVGYGAGVTSPGWYDHLWEYARDKNQFKHHSENLPQDDSLKDAENSAVKASNTQKIAIAWLTKVASLLRKEGISASSAQVIDAVRLAETLAALRARANIGLSELNEAAYAVFAGGNPHVLSLIYDQLIIADTLGQVSEDVPATPLQLDLKAQQKTLRLKPTALSKELDLDLRKPNGLARSIMLHRLRLLGIPWGQKKAWVNTTGTFKESWRLSWQPEYTLLLIEAGRYGQTLAEASSNYVVHKSLGLANVSQLSELLDDTLLADLPVASEALVRRLELHAAQDQDLHHLLQAFPKLAYVVRYGNVRTNLHENSPKDLKEDSDNKKVEKNNVNIGNIAKVARGIFTRLCLALPQATQAIDDDEARALFSATKTVHGAVQMLADARKADANNQVIWRNTWQHTLYTLTQQAQIHPLIVGCSYKLLLDAGMVSSAAATKALTLALSNSDVAGSASWLEGFLSDGGLLLVYDDALFNVLDNWLLSLSEDTFMRILPLVRRTFSSFADSEKESIGRKVKGAKQVSNSQFPSLDEARGVAIFTHFQNLITTNSGEEKTQDKA